MIVVHNVHGEPLALNGELIERVEGGTETHVTLVNGVRYIVGETIDEVVNLCREDRAEVRSMAQRMLALPVPPADVASETEVGLHLVEGREPPGLGEDAT